MTQDTVDFIFGLAFFGLMAVAFLYFKGIRSWEDLRRWVSELGEANARLAQERASGIEMALAPAEVLDIVTEDMTRSGYGVESRTENTVTFSRSAQMNPAIGCLLALLFLLPAIIYMLAVAGKTMRVTVAAYPLGTGSRVVIGGDSRAAVANLRRWLRTRPGRSAGGGQFV